MILLWIALYWIVMYCGWISYIWYSNDRITISDVLFGIPGAFLFPVLFLAIMCDKYGDFVIVKRRIRK
jgi:hypothetical protein